MPQETHHPAWIGRLGRLTLLVNAKTREAAMEAALDQAGNFYFATERTLSEDDPWPSSAQGEPSSPPPPEALEGGAWSVLVARIGHASAGRDSEYDSEYLVESARFSSPMPHLSPHASDDLDYWAKRRQAILEREAIDATLDSASAATRSSSSPRI